MKPTRARKRLHLKGTIFALLIAAMATQVGGATMELRASHEPPVAHVTAAALPVPGEHELLTWLAAVSRGPPDSGSWALLVAGLAGIGAIGWRRMSALGGRSLDPYRLRRR